MSLKVTNALGCMAACWSTALCLCRPFCRLPAALCFQPVRPDVRVCTRVDAFSDRLAVDLQFLMKLLAYSVVGSAGSMKLVSRLTVCLSAPSFCYFDVFL